MDLKRDLPKHVINTVIETVFVKKYIDGKYRPIHEYDDFTADKLIHITEVLRQYYSLNEREDHALADLYTWKDEKLLFDKIQSDYSALTGAYKEISHSIDNLYHMEREREDRRRYENRERYNEKWERTDAREYELQNIYKEVAYKEVPFEKFRERVAQYNHQSPVYRIDIPNISIDKEIFQILDTRLSDQRNKIDAMASAKNEAFSILKQYVYQIVLSEKISPPDSVD